MNVLFIDFELSKQKQIKAATNDIGNTGILVIGFVLMIA